jgi:hypothetical protein
MSSGIEQALGKAPAVLSQTPGDCLPRCWQDSLLHRMESDASHSAIVNEAVGRFLFFGSVRVFRIRAKRAEVQL